MLDYKSAFMQLALDHGVLRFGQFTLKSGRVSPYFFNLGQISSGAALGTLGRAYAAALQASGIEVDMLFGPAYKGIPLVTATAIAFAEQGRDLPFAYNRKEAKDHGEGGVLVGARPAGRVAIVDDVLTAGTALREAVQLLRRSGAEPVAAVIALDRQEIAADGLSAVAQLERDAGLRVVPLITVAELLGFLERERFAPEIAESIRSYQARYGAAA